MNEALIATIDEVSCRFEIVDLGVDATLEAFLNAVKEGINLIGMSALLTTTMSNMSFTIEALRTSGLRDQVKVMVGSAPTTKDYAKSIGADAFAPDASADLDFDARVSAYVQNLQAGLEDVIKVNLQNFEERHALFYEERFVNVLLEEVLIAGDRQIHIKFRADILRLVQGKKDTEIL